MASLSRHIGLYSLVLLVCVGCKDKSYSSTPGSNVDKGSAQHARARQEPVFEILDQGTPPLLTLRYNLSSMKPQYMKIDMDMSVGAQAQGTDIQPPQDLPPISMIIYIEPLPISARKHLPYTFKVISTEVNKEQDDDSSMADGMKAELERLDGLSGSAEVSIRGVTDKVEIHLNGDDDDRNELLNRMREEIIGMSVPLPQQPVGQGARWTVTRTLKSGSIKMKQTTNYSLEKLDKTSMKIAVDMEQNADPQPLDSKNLAGASARLVSLHSDGGGTSLIDFSKLVPTANAFSHTNLVMELRAHGNQQRVTTTLDLKMTMNPIDKIQNEKSGKKP